MLNGEQASKQDPDYDEVIETPDSYRRSSEVHCNREHTIKRIRDILERHFNGEIEAKEEEVLLIENRISQSREMLDKLRAYLLANYYGFKGKVLYGKESKRRAATKRKANNGNLRSNVCKESPCEMENDSICLSEIRSEQEGKLVTPSSIESDSSKAVICSLGISAPSACKTETGDQESATSSRFYAHKEIIVGNISKFIPLEKREKNDQATHKWMVYVRGPPGAPDVSSYVKQVWFILHPSYMPNDMIEVSKPPFTVTRRGWGEFPVRIQLVFHDPRNKPVDIIHNLKLDKTYTGLQTLGAETTVALEMQRHTVEEETRRCSSLAVETVKEQSYAGTGAKLLAKDSGPVVTIKKEDVTVLGSENIALDKPTDALINVHRQRLEKKGHSLSSAASSPASITASEPSKSRAASPSIYDRSRDEPVETSKELESVVVETLLKNISSFPLISEERDITKHHYCAKSLEQYKRWSLSKRRASEWQRALDIKRFLLKTGIVDTIKTKDVMFWCRVHGFTPSESNGSVVDGTELDYCPKCGKCFPTSDEVSIKWCSTCLSDKEIKNTCSLTSFEEMLDVLFTQESKLENLDKGYDPDQVENNVVDVVGTDAKEKAIDTGLSLVNTSQLSPIDSYQLVDWIYEAAAQIEVHLPSITVNEQKVPVLAQILSCAMKSLVKDILAHSYAHAKDGKTNLQPVVVTPHHVLHGLKQVPHLDFLTNSFFGIQEEDGTI